MLGTHLTSWGKSALMTRNPASFSPPAFIFFCYPTSSENYRRPLRVLPSLLCARRSFRNANRIICSLIRSSNSSETSLSFHNVLSHEPFHFDCSPGSVGSIPCERTLRMNAKLFANSFSQLTKSQAGIILEQRQSAVSGWKYYGCYTEGTSSRALSSKATAYDTMTVESCASDCAGYTYFGVEYGRECRYLPSPSSSHSKILPRLLWKQLLRWICSCTSERLFFSLRWEFS
jgi:hypothetical protein